MLRIRRDQLRALAIEDSIREVRRRYREICFGHDQTWLRNLVIAAFRKAELYGIESQNDVLTLAGWMLTIHPNFEYLGDGAWVRTILEQRDMTGGEKIGLIAEQLPRRALSRRRSGVVEAPLGAANG